MSGIEEPAQHADDGGRDFANVLLFVPRHVADFLFWGTSVAVAVLENQQVVPRVQGFVSTPGGRLAVLPTLFVETGGVFSVGARMIADLGPVATGLRLGFGGVHSFEIEPRMTFRLDVPLSTINVEGLYKQDNDLEYLGVGQVPERDPRNRFLPGQRGAEAQYFEERVRWILGYAVRPAEVVELLASVSLDRRKVLDAYDADVVLSDVFAPGSIPGDLEPSSMLFSESAVRVDTRATRGRPSAGFLGEAYAGGGRDTRGGDIDLVRYGGRLAGFFPIYRTTNILSPRVVLDGVAPLYDTELPFTELTGQPDFRGFDTRRDRISLVGSLEYRWLMIESVGVRLFGDTAVVAPDFANIDFEALRWALGMALDLQHGEFLLLLGLGWAGDLGTTAGPSTSGLTLPKPRPRSMFSAAQAATSARGATARTTVHRSRLRCSSSRTPRSRSSEAGSAPPTGGGHDGEDLPGPSDAADGADGMYGGDACSAETVAGGAAVVNPCEGGLPSVGGNGLFGGTSLQSAPTLAEGGPGPRLGWRPLGSPAPSSASRCSHAARFEPTRPRCVSPNAVPYLSP